MVAVFLVGAQLGLQAPGQPGRFALRRAQAREGIAEFGVPRHRHAFQGFVGPGRGDLRDARAVLVRLHHGGQIGQAVLEVLRERGVDAVAHGDEAALLTSSVEQRLEGQHQPVVQGSLAADPEPVALGTDDQAQLRGIDAHHPHGLALGPLHGCHGGQAGQDLHHRQRLFRVAHQPFASPLNLRVFQEGQRVEHGIQVGALRVQITLRTHGLLADHRHDASAPAGGRKTRPLAAQRRHHQTQEQVFAVRREFRVQARIRHDFARNLGRVAVHLEMPRQYGHGLFQFLLRRGGHLEVPGDQEGCAALRRGQTDDLEALRRDL